MINKDNSLYSTINKVRSYYNDHLKDIENIGSIAFLIILIPLYFIYISRKFDANTVSNIIISGLVQGAYYSLIAVGFSIIFGIAKMFKLSIGGYFVMGAYVAFWLTKVFYLPINEIANTPIIDSTTFIFKILIYAPIIIYFALFPFYISWDKKIGSIIVVLNLVLFIYQRSLLVTNYFKFNLEATFLAIVIQMSTMIMGTVLIYFELSKKQVLSSIVFLNVLVIILNNNTSFPESPGVYVAVFLISVTTVACVAMLVDRYLLEKVRNNQINVLIITFGLALLIQSIIPLFKYPDNGEFIEFGIDPKNLEGIVAKYESYILLGQPIQSIRVIAAVLSILLLLMVYIFINYTPMGHAMKAVSEDPEAAWLVGINVRKVYLISAGLGMGLSAAAGVITSPFSATPTWSVYMGWVPLIFAIAVVTLGGVGSIFGSAIAGFILGFTEVTIASDNIQLSKIVPLMVILIIIIVRPNGLFGVVEEDE